MSADQVPAASPGDDGVRYERIDNLTVNVYVEGPGDTTVRPAEPVVQRALERDRDQIAELLARTRQEQERLNSRSCPRPSDQEFNGR